MATLTGDILGHPQVGVHVSIVGDVLFHPFSLDDDAKQLLSETFDMEMVPFSIGGSSLLGSLVRGNRNGIAVARHSLGVRPGSIVILRRGCCYGIRC